MKTLSILIMLLGGSFAANVAAHADDLLGNGVIQAHLMNIRDHVRECSIVPYTYRNGVKVYHHLLSHCLDVRVIGKGQATVKIGGNVFYVSLVESDMSDGDLFNVDIREYTANDHVVLENVHAYGDVLLGILNGNTRGVMKSYVPENEMGLLHDER